jgi:DNA-binding Lrp family transcriptional regulator
VLRPQDILVLLKLALWEGDWTFEQVARQLALSPSAVHRSLDRAARAGLYRPSKRSVDRAALIDFLVHALRYVFPPRWGGEARGIPTAWAAAPLDREIPHRPERRRP